MIKGNQPELKLAIEEWLLLRRPAGLQTPPDWEEIEKGHGRLEKRRLWLEPCDAEMQRYLLESFGWPGVQWCGWIARRRKVLASGEVAEKVHVWIGGAYFAWALTAEQAAGYLRQHWGIENGVFYVRDVSMDEDRLSGRKIGHSLSGIRNGALNLLRRLGASYIPDARRHLAARPDMGLALLMLDY